MLGIHGIEETCVYQRILAKGRAEGEAKGRVQEAREVLLRQGQTKLGEPSERVRDEIEAMSDLERLNALLDRILDVSSWDELLLPVDPAVSREAK
jgi:predicted transposase YdaD